MSNAPAGHSVWLSLWEEGREGPKRLSFQGTAVKVSHKVGHLEKGVDKVRCQRSAKPALTSQFWGKQLTEASVLKETEEHQDYSSRQGVRRQAGPILEYISLIWPCWSLCLEVQAWWHPRQDSDGITCSGRGWWPSL